jgi:hypothetical protein
MSPPVRSAVEYGTRLRRRCDDEAVLEQLETDVQPQETCYSAATPWVPLAGDALQEAACPDSGDHQKWQARVEPYTLEGMCRAEGEDQVVAGRSLRQHMSHIGAEAFR